MEIGGILESELGSRTAGLVTRVAQNKKWLETLFFHIKVAARSRELLVQIFWNIFPSFSGLILYT